MPKSLSIKRPLLAVMTLVLAVSCVPHRERYRLVVPVPAAAAAPVEGHRLLRLLALDDPLGRPAPLAPQLSGPVTDTGTPAPPFLLNAADDTAQRAQQCLTQAVYYEARSEPLDGQRAVAQVVLNRVRDRAFPDSVCKVVYQHPANRPGCQFSFACDGSMDKPIEPRAWNTASAVAQAALAGSVYAPIGSATYYHTTAVLPWWAGSLQRIGLVGSHIFYRWGAAMSRALSFRQAYSGNETLPQPAVIAAATESSGVVVHRAGQASSAEVVGVTIHRASALPAAQSGLVRTHYGVTVHYGAAADVGDAADAAPAVAQSGAETTAS
jgi:hypothetical protein